MTLDRKRMRIWILAMALVAACAASGRAEKKPQSPAGTPAPIAAGESKACVNCHRGTTPAIVSQWEKSKHAPAGVGCLDCHGA